MERFYVRRELALTVEYGLDGRACRMRISPRYSLTHFGPNDPAAGMDMVTDVLNEVVPREARGKELGPGEGIRGSCAGAPPPTEYDNVTIIPYYEVCQKPLVNWGVDVVFKRQACESVSRYSER